MEFTLRLEQLVYTLTELPRVERVRFWVNGEPWGHQNHAGERIDEYTRTTTTVCEGRITGECRPD